MASVVSTLGCRVLSLCPLSVVRIVTTLHLYLSSVWAITQATCWYGGRRPSVFMQAFNTGVNPSSVDGLLITGCFSVSLLFSVLVLQSTFKHPSNAEGL